MSNYLLKELIENISRKAVEQEEISEELERSIEEERNIKQFRDTRFDDIAELTEEMNRVRLGLEHIGLTEDLEDILEQSNEEIQQDIQDIQHANEAINTQQQIQQNLQREIKNRIYALNMELSKIRF